MALFRDTVITWLGHSTLLIETPGGKRILIDPFVQSNPSCPAEWKAVEKLTDLDLILITHAHGDHIGDAATVFAANPQATVVSIYDIVSEMETRGAKQLSGMNRGGSQTIGDIRVTMTQAIHSSSFADSEGHLTYGGEPCGYIVRLENEFTFYAAGDTAVFGDMALLKELYAPELAFLPIGDHFTMGPKEAALAVKLLGVKAVVPIHYGTFPVLTGTADAFRKALRHQPDVIVYAPQPGETLR